MARWIAAIIPLAWYIWRLDHAIRAQLLPKDLPHLFNAGGKCEVIRDKDVNPQFRYCEDGLVFAPGIALFSCDPGRNTSTSTVDTLLEPDTHGGLWAMHYTSTSFEPPYLLELAGYPTDAEFHPLGIDITPRDNSGGPPHLLVANRGLGQPTVEVFDVELASGVVTIVYRTTLRHSAFTAPNAIFAMSPNAFYVSQDHYFTGRMTWPFSLVLPWLETILALPFGRVHLVQFEATEGLRQVTTAASMIPCANGVAVSLDGSTLAVASTNRAEVLFYERTGTTIKLVSSAQVPFSADNIAFVGERLLVAGHPYLPAYVALVKQESSHAPSHVVSIEPRGSKGSWLARATAGVDVVDVFKSDGSFFSSSSGAFVDLEAGSMFVVGLYAPGIAKCSFA